MSSIGERVEDADMNVGVGAQRHDLCVAGPRVGIVEQQSNTHTAIGGSQESIGEKLAGLVLAKDEILEVDCTGGRIDHLRPDEKSVHPI